MSSLLPDPELSAARAKRLQRARSGAEVLRLWILDRLETGVATPDREATAAIAARLVDAQAAGLAREVRKLNEIAASGIGWEKRYLDQLGLLFLATEALKLWEDQPLQFREEFLQWIGFSIQKKQLPEEGRLLDIWHVAAQRVWIEDKVTVQKSWLHGENSELWWVHFSYRVNELPFDPNLRLGRAHWGEVALYPGATQLRGALTKFDPEPRPFRCPPGTSVSQLQTEFAQLVAKFPWIEALGGGIAASSLERQDANWVVADACGERLLLDTPEDRGWTIASLSGGGPCVLYGEMNGLRYLPTSMAVEGEFSYL